MWNVLPYQAVNVQIDSLSLQDPSWIPALPGRALRPSPQQFTTVDFALVRTREIAGVLLPGAKIATTAGVGLELRDVDGGALNASRTFSDGAFYFGRVRPGHYRLALTKTSASALGITTPPEIDVVVGADSDAIIELEPITLEHDTRGP
jgi:hypothetical protein